MSRSIFIGAHRSRNVDLTIAAVCAAALLSACGGDGGSDTGAATYKIGGVVSALDSGKQLVLQNNGGDDLTVTSNGTFNFPSRLAAGAAYAVTVKTQPAGQTCGVSNGSGNVSADVSNVSVTCVTGSTPTPTPTPTPTGPTQGAAGVAGTWVQSLCVVANGKGNRQLLRVAQTGTDSVSLEHDLMVYAATNCSGSGSPLGVPTPTGSVTFSRSAATATLAANWGLWTYPTGQAYVILAKKGETVLCLIGDANPSVLPTAADVEGYADLSIPSGACYVKQ